jgi:hypothetical protein
MFLNILLLSFMYFFRNLQNGQQVQETKLFYLPRGFEQRYGFVFGMFFAISPKVS